MTSVWVVAESRSEWYEIKHICATEKIALKFWNELRLELIKENYKVVDYCVKTNSSPEPWSSAISLLHNMNPGENPGCDYPDLQEWVVEE
jgi:hypothetical protein